MHTFIGSQLNPLFEAASDLDQSSFSVDGEDDLMVVDRKALEALVREAKALRDLKQTLRMGIHHHTHGESHYLFLLPEGVEMNETDLERNLQEDFEPEHGETLGVERIDTPELFAPITEEVQA